jgi:hypothetical protein
MMVRSSQRLFNCPQVHGLLSIEKKITEDDEIKTGQNIFEGVKNSIHSE